ncbi:hypothetical protein [Streptomyces thioluteus]|uniref:hypothetical protein n=1 Tax=Streptomyces thioluteus TaxID=66431 RepID=UPI003CD0AB94
MDVSIGRSTGGRPGCVRKQLADQPGLDTYLTPGRRPGFVRRLGTLLAEAPGQGAAA